MPAGRFSESDRKFMAEALVEARVGAAEGEVPVGAVIACGGKIVGRGHNRPIALNDPTAHAEVLALREASRTLGTYRLVGATVYVTLEPCVMCAGALINARVKVLKYGANDLKAGALGSVYDIGRDGRLSHSIEVYGSLMESECAEPLKEFFRSRRAGKCG